MFGERILAENVKVSNDTRKTGLNNNDLIIGSSGCGKTGGYVIPNIQNIEGSLIVSDTKGQLERRFKSFLIEKGYEVYNIDLVNMNRSNGYNPLEFIGKNKDGSYSEKDILSLANLLCPKFEAVEKDAFWRCSAASYVAFLISFCLEAAPAKNHNLIHLAEIHRTFSAPKGDGQFTKWVEDHPDSFASKKFKEVNATRNADKTFSSIIAFVNQYLEPFEFKEAESIFGKAKKDNFDIRILGKQKTVVFLNNSDTDRTFDSISNIFYSQVLRILCAEADANENGHLDVPVRLIMDDFASGAQIPDFDKVISVIRSRGISVSLIIQSISQLESLYSKCISNTIINNCDHLIYMGSQDLDSANFVGNRAMKTPETILTMPRNQVCLITAGEKAKFVEKIVPYSTLNEREIGCLHI